MPIKIATLNLCLGLKNKKQSVKNIITSENIDILCLQEIELEKDYNSEMLTLPGYDLEIEKNDVKSRTGIYVSQRIPYKRRKDLEGLNSHIVIIDIEGKKTTVL